MRFVKVLLAAGVLAAVVAPNAMAFRFDDSARNPPTGVTGQPYDHPLQTVAGCKGVAITVLSGSLPPGLRLSGNKRDDVDGSDWKIVGTPTTPGRYPFYLQATNICGDSTEEDFVINVVQGLTIGGPGLPVGTVGQPYPSQQLTASGGGTHTWSIASGALPTGLTLSPSGLISGTPTEAVQSKSVQIRVSDGGRVAVRNYEISIRAPLAISAVSVPAASRISRAYRVGPLVATGGSGGYSWSLAGGTLPAGVSLNASTGVIEGVPTVAGNFPIRIRVTDSEGRTAEAGFTIQIASPVSIVTTRLATLRLGRLYSLAIKTEGGVGIRRYGRDTFNWRILRGKLPLGLRLNTRVGKLIGRPRRAGTYRVTFRVSDRFRSVDTQTLVIKVNK